jgi:hypothetical protein
MLSIFIFFIWVDLRLDKRILLIYLRSDEILRKNLIILLLFLLVHESVQFKLDALELFPVASESKHGFQDKFALGFSEYSILAHCIKTNDILFVNCFDWRQNYFFIGFFLVGEFGASCLCLGLEGSLQSLMLSFFFLLLSFRLVVCV